MDIKVDDLGNPNEDIHRPDIEWVAECILLRYVIVSHFGTDGLKEVEEKLPGLVKVMRESWGKKRWWEFWK